MAQVAFNELVRQALRRGGHKERSGAELVSAWSFLVDQCEDGYGWTLCEFDDEVSVRDYLESVLRDPDIIERPESLELAWQVHQIDNRFLALLQPGVLRPGHSSQWWRTGVLQFAGDDYRHDLGSLFSIHVDPCDG